MADIRRITGKRDASVDSLVLVIDGRSYGSAAWFPNLQAYVVNNRRTGLVNVEAKTEAEATALLMQGVE